MSAAEIQRGRELDLARLALHLRETMRAARRLGLRVLPRELGAGARAALMVEGLTATRGVESVPEIKLEERELAQRLPLRELLEQIADELRDRD